METAHQKLGTATKSLRQDFHLDLTWTLAVLHLQEIAFPVLSPFQDDLVLDHVILPSNCLATWEDIWH